MATDHDQWQRFCEVADGPQQSELLRGAQLSLTRCGISASCFGRPVKIQRKNLSQAQGFELPEPKKLFAQQIEPIAGSLCELTLESSEDL